MASARDRTLWFYVCLVLLAVLPGSATAGLRQPQVPITGTGLQDILQASNGTPSPSPTPDAGTEQLDAQLLQIPFSSTASFGTEIRLVAHSPGTEIGEYSGHESSPVFRPLFPADARPGWGVVLSFRTSPTRIQVSVLDETGALVGTQVFPGGDKTGIGFYVKRASGTYFTQDDRNPSGETRALFYAGATASEYWYWIAWDDGAGDPGDFADDVLTVDSQATGRVTSVSRTSWGELKRRFE